MAGPALVISTPLVSPSTAGIILYGYAVVSGTNLARIDAGQVCFLRDTMEWDLVSVLSASTGATGYRGVSPTQMRGIAVNSAYERQPLTVCIQDPSFIVGATLVTGLTFAAYGQGDIVDTGAIASTDYRVCVGVAASTKYMPLNLSATGQTS